MKRILLKTLTLVLLLTGSMLQALTNDELYAHAEEVATLLPELAIKIHPYEGETQEDRIASLKLNAEDETILFRYVRAIEVVDKKLEATVMSEVLPRIPAVCLGLIIGGPVAASLEGAWGDRIGNWDVGMGKIVLSALAYQYGSKRVMGKKLRTLKRTAVEALLKDDGTFTRALTVLTWWHHFHRFVNTLLYTVGGMGVIRVAAN